ncbi:MAG: hypothetical protein ACI4A8_03490 [Muribaculaceae bacterium]
MDNKIKRLLSTVYELEGLLLLANDSRHKIDELIFELIRNKGMQINELMAQLGNYDEVTPIAVAAETTAPEPADEYIEPEEPEVPGTPEEDEAPEVPEVIEEADVPNEPIMADEPEEFTDEPINEDSIDSAMPATKLTFDIDDELQQSADTTDEHHDYMPRHEEPRQPNVAEKETEKRHSIDEMMKKYWAYIPHDDSGPDQYDDDDDSDNDSTDEGIDVSNDDNSYIDQDYNDNGDSDEQVRLDDVLQRNISKNLKRAFTLNDRFRYRRELFENSDVQMSNALDLVETMHSYAEAEEYFYGDREWDRESPEVKDFMEIIRKHFA